MSNHHNVNKPDIATTYVKNMLIQHLSQFRTFLAETADRFVGLHNLKPKDENLSADAYKLFMIALRTQVFDSNQQWTYFLHRQELTADSIKLLVFANLALEETHLVVWYASKFTPFRDPKMRAEIKTTMPLMLSESAAGVSIIYVVTMRVCY